MLKLTIKEDEWIRITKDGKVVARFLLETIEQGTRAKVGVEAPDDYLILREELILDEEEFEAPWIS